MSDQKDNLLNRGLELGMSVMQKVLSNPTAGPLLMKAVRQTMELKQSVEEQREKLIEKMQLASSHEQEQLRRNLTSVEKKLERLERRLRETQKKAKEAERKISEYEASQEQQTNEETKTSQANEETKTSQANENKQDQA